jgi:tetratricopeptide (TPR) repeat protein
MLFKTIISGRLEFGNQRALEKVLEMYTHRMENYFKSDVLIKIEEMIQPESLSISIPRFIGQTSEKTWLNTTNLFDYIAQFAIAGSISMWMIDQGKVVSEKHIEPSGDKAAVQSFKTGKNLADQPGKEDEAKQAFNSAIEKFERHALAYERRGYINYKLGNYDDALYDFNKSIQFHPENPDPHVGVAIVLMTKQDFSSALNYLDTAMKNSIPHQPIYWQCRRLKGEALIALSQFEDAVKELKLFLGRNFSSSDPNHKWIGKATFDCGKALLHAGKYLEAVEMLDKSQSIEEHPEFIPLKDMALQKSMA